MATHSSVLAWRIPGTVEPGGLPSMGSHRVGHYWSDLAAAAAVIKNPPTIQEPQEMQALSLYHEDSREEGMATHSSILSWRIPWTEEPGRPHTTGPQRIRHNWNDLPCTHALIYSLVKLRFMDLNHITFKGLVWQAPLSMEFSRKEYWKGSHFLLQGIFPTQGSNSSLPLGRRILYYWATWETHI